MADIYAFISANTLAFGAVSFLLGLLLGHWLELGRDKRKDFNALAAEPFEALVNQRERLEACSFGQIVKVPWRQLQPLVPVWQRARLRHHAQRYEQGLRDSIGPYDTASGTQTIDADALRRTIPSVDALIRLLSPR